MPPAIIPAVIAGVVGVASMVNQNVQNKAAIKSNETQQNSAIANAQAATKAAANQESQYAAANPAPTQGATVAAPPTYGAAKPASNAMAQIASSPMVKSIIQAAQTGASAPSQASVTPSPAGLYAANTPTATSPNVGANLVQKILAAAA